MNSLVSVIKQATFVLLTALAAAPLAMAQQIQIVTVESPPYNFTAEQEPHITGLSTEIVQEIFRRARLSYEIQFFPWARAYTQAKHEPHVAIYSLVRNEEREHAFKWVGVIAHMEILIYKLKRRSDIRASHLAELKPYLLGGVRGDFRSMYLSQQGLRVELVTADINNLKKLQDQRIDVLASDPLALRALALQNGVLFDTMEPLFKLDKLSSDLQLAFSLQTPDDTVEKCRQALADMVKDSTYQRITQKWRKPKTLSF
jgi:polar amino acid transport system substrate-binding protein